MGQLARLDLTLSIGSDNPRAARRYEDPEIALPCDPRAQPAQLPTAIVLASETVVKHGPT